jgi:hypothetical protein
MKAILWVYAVVGTLYFMMNSAGMATVVKYATGPLWLMMIVAPVILILLVAQRLGLFGK